MFEKIDYVAGGISTLSVCLAENTMQQRREHSPVSPSLKSCSLKYMYSKLTDVYKEEHKEPEWTVTPKREGEKRLKQPGN